MFNSLRRCPAAISRAALQSGIQLAVARRPLPLQSRLVLLNPIAKRSISQTPRFYQEAQAQSSYEDSAPASEDARPEVITRFDDLGNYNVVHKSLVEAITQDMGLETMTEVQIGTINEALKGADL
jgi:ATP-dependent RNA helicase MSS116